MAADIAILEDVADATCRKRRLVPAGKNKIYGASWAPFPGDSILGTRSGWMWMRM